MKYTPLTKDELQRAERSLLALGKERVRLLNTIDVAEAFETLCKVPEYDVVFNQFFFKDEVLRTHSLLPEKVFMKEDDRLGLQDDLLSLAVMRDKLNSLTRVADHNKKQLEEVKSTIAQTRSMIDNGVPESIEEDSDYGVVHE